MELFKRVVSFLPSAKQWRGWSLPSKYTVVGFYFALLPFLIAGGGYVVGKVESYLAKKISVDAVKLDIKGVAGLQEGFLLPAGSEINVSYPAVNYIIPNDFLEGINKEVESSILEYLSSGLLEYNVDYEVGVVTSEVISFKVYQYYYYKGAANGNASEFAYNFDPLRKLNFDFFDVFDARRNALNGLKKIIAKKIKAVCESGVFYEFFNESSFIPRFFIKNEGVDFVFSEYEVTPGYCGSFAISVGYDELSSYLKRDGPLGRMAPASGQWEAGTHFMNAIKSAMNSD